MIEDKSPYSENFIEQLNYKYEKELNTKIVKEKCEIGLVDENFSYKELEKFNELIKESKFIFEPFNKVQYLLYKKCFYKNLPKNILFKENNLTKTLKMKLKDIYEDFIDLNKFENALKLIKKQECNHNSESLGEILKDSYKLLFEENKRIYKPVELIAISSMLAECLNNFLTISKSSKILEQLKSDNLVFKENLCYKMRFKILVIGKYSSGKSSTLNSIIGYDLDLLDASENECTKKAFVIKYCKDFSDISLLKSKLIKSEFGLYYFEEEKEVAKGAKKVKIKINELNHERDCNLNIIY